jgi:DNA ligase (NAD+)
MGAGEAGRRGDPAGGRPGAGAAHRRRAAVRPAGHACPSCGTPGGAARGRGHALLPEQAPARPHLLGLVHFVSQDAMDIRGPGRAHGRAAAGEGLVSRLRRPVRTDGGAAHSGLEGFGDLSARNLVQAIAASREQPLSRLLFALGIRHVGQHAAQVLARSSDMDALLDATRRRDFAAVHGIGATTAEALGAFMAEPRNRELIAAPGGAGSTWTSRSSGPSGRRSQDVHSWSPARTA